MSENSPLEYRIVEGTALSNTITPYHGRILRAHNLIFPENAARTFDACNGVGKGNAPHWVLCVTRDSDEVAGMATCLEGFNPVTHAVAVYNVGVVPAHRRRGVGRLVYERVAAMYPDYEGSFIVDEHDSESQRFATNIAPGARHIRRVRRNVSKGNDHNET